MIREEFWGKKWEFPFVVYKPTEMKEGLPLIIQLHGAGEVGSKMEDLGKVDVHGFSHMLAEDEEYPCVFVLPQCMEGSFWVAELPNLYRFIQTVKQMFLADEKRIYLTGLSMGGYGTWYTALRYPELFAAIAPVCGGGMVWKAGALDMPVWAFHGAMDGTVNVTETLHMIQQIRNLGCNKAEVRMTILDNVGHDAWEYAYTPELLDWLLSKSR